MAITLLALGLAACSSSKSSGEHSTSTSSEPIVIGAVAAQSGTYGAYGLADVKGMQAEINLINAKGGVLGHKLKLVALDDQSDPAKAVSAVQQLLSQDPAPVMVHCGAVSVDCAAILPTTGRAKVITMTPAATPAFQEPSENPYNFVVFPSSDLQVDGTVALMKASGSPEAGIIASNDTGGKAIAEAMQKGFPKAGLNLRKTAYISPTATDMTPQLQSLRSAGVKVLFAQFASPTEFVTLMTNIQSIGWTDVHVVAGTTAVAETVFKAIPDAVADQFSGLGTRAVARSGPDLTSLPAKQQAFMKEMKRIGAPSNFMIGSVNGGDEVSLLAWAIEQAKSTESAKVYDVLNHLGRDTKWPSDLMMEIPHPDWSPTNHGLKGADFSAYWASISPSKSVQGTYRGKIIPLTA